MIADELRAVADRADYLVAPHMAKDIRALADRVAEVERDAARYRWMKANCGWEHDGPNNWKWYTLVPFMPGPDNFDAAIDAAIRERIKDKPRPPFDPNQGFGPI